MASEETLPKDCPVCLEEDGSWKTLRCKHSFCDRCLDTLSAGQSLKCPLCREITWVIDGEFVEHIPKQPTLFKCIRLDSFIGYVCLDDKSERLFVATNDARKPIQVFNYQGEFIDSVGKDVVSGSGPSVTVDTKRGLIVANDEHKVATFDCATGACVREFTDAVEFKLLQGIAYHSYSDQYILTDCRKHCAMFMDPNTGTITSKFGSAGSGDSNFYWPSDICCDKTGQTPYIAISDKDNYCIKRFDCEGNFVDKFGSEGGDFGEFSQIYGTCMDSQGRILTADAGNSRVVRINPAANEIVHRWECVLPPGRLSDEEPLVVDVNDKGHMAVATGLSSGGAGSTLHLFNEYE